MWKNNDPQCSVFNEPPFDPEHFSDWFDWFDDCMSGEIQIGPPSTTPPNPPPCKPGVRIVNGRCIEVFCTVDGPQIQGCYKIPRTPIIKYAVISGIRVTNNGYIVQTFGPTGLRTETVPKGKVRLRHLGSALLTQKKLPQASINKVPAKFWKSFDSPIPARKKTATVINKAKK